MDEIFGNVIEIDVPTDEILDSLPSDEKQQVEFFLNDLRSYESNIPDILNKCKYAYNNFQKDIFMYSCFTLATNLLLWEYHKNKNKVLEELYNDIYCTFDSSIEKFFKDEKDLQYYYKLTD